MPHSLTAAQLAAYRDEGYLALRCPFAPACARVAGDARVRGVLS
jgi:hypothetical protein